MSSFYSINVSFVYNTCVAIIDVIAQNANYLKKRKIVFFISLTMYYELLFN